MISAIEMTTRMGLFIIFALGVATIVSSFGSFRKAKFMKIWVYVLVVCLWYCLYCLLLGFG